MEKTKKAKIIYEGRQKRKIPVIPIILILLVIAVLAVGILSNWTFFIKKTASESDNPIVSVNGEIITQNQLNEQWNTLPAAAKIKMTKEQLLKELIQEKLLLQEAKKENIEVTEPEVEQFINMQLSQLGMTYKQFEDALVAQGTTAEDMKNIYQKQLTIAKLFDGTINSTINATDKEVEAYYEQNKEKFYRDEQVTVKHILVEVNKGMNESMAQQRVDTILRSLNSNNSNFCELVSEYSSDLGSVKNCGEYTFGHGQMVEEFEKAAYEMKIGEKRVVKTSYGYHIMLKVGDTKAGYVGLDDKINETEGSPTVREAIRQSLIQEKAQKIFDEYTSNIEKTAEITYFEDLNTETSFEPNKTIIKE